MSSEPGAAGVGSGDAAGRFARPMLSEQIVQHLTRQIADGVWPAGTVLAPEPELARQLGVSRTVIRESVRVLSSRGMLQVQQGRGTVVAPVSAWNVTEPLALLVKADRPQLLNWLEVRTILEVSSAGLAAQRLTQDGRASLAAALERVRHPDPDPGAYLEADVAFHLAVAEAAHNPQLTLLLRPLLQPIRERLERTALMNRARAAAKREHATIAAAILAGDEPAARQAMQTHLNRVAAEIRAVVQ